MNILVCVKQVPDTTQIKIDPVKHTLIREGVPAILNPFDGYALEAAARVKDKDPSTKITVVTMGPPQATAVLKECVGIAADKGYLVSGRTFGGSDTLLPTSSPTQSRLSRKRKASSTQSSAASRLSMVILLRSAPRSLSGLVFPRLPMVLSARQLRMDSRLKRKLKTAFRSSASRLPA